MSGIIDRAMFSFSFSDNDNKLIMGSYNMKYAAEGALMTWHPVVDTTYWTITIEQVELGEFAFEMKSTRAIVDSGSSYIHVPYVDFKSFEEHIS